MELFVRFGKQDDRRRMIDSAKKLGWLEANYLDDENFLDGDSFLEIKIFKVYAFSLCLDQKDLGCLVKLSIDRIQFPIQLATQTDKDRLSVFAQYRFYDKSIQNHT